MPQVIGAGAQGIVQHVDGSPKLLPDIRFQRRFHIKPPVDFLFVGFQIPPNGGPEPAWKAGLFLDQAESKVGSAAGELNHSQSFQLNLFGSEVFKWPETARKDHRHDVNVQLIT